MNPELKKYVEQSRITGKSDETIKHELLGAGWSEMDISQALNAVQIPAAPFANNTENTVRVNEDRSTKNTILFLRILGVLGILAVLYSFSGALALASLWGGGINIYSLVMLLVVLSVPIALLFIANNLRHKKSPIAYSVGIIIVTIIGLLTLYEFLSTMMIFLAMSPLKSLLIVAMPTSLLSIVIIVFCFITAKNLYNQNKLLYGKSSADKYFLILLVLIILFGVYGLINKFQYERVQEIAADKRMERFDSLPQSGSLITQRGIVIDNSGTSDSIGIKIIRMQSETPFPGIEDFFVVYHLGPDPYDRLCKYYNPDAALLKKGDKIEIHGRVEGYNSTDDTHIHVSTCDTPDFYIHLIGHSSLSDNTPDSTSVSSPTKEVLKGDRAKAVVAFVRNSIVNLGASLENFYYSHSSYSGYCLSEELKKTESNINGMPNVTEFVCKDSSNQYVVYVKLVDNSYWCLDNTMDITTQVFESPTGTSCGNK